MAQALRGWALDRWHGEVGQAPLGASLAVAPKGPPVERWRWRSHDPNDTLGKPLCAGAGVVALVVQNAVVGMRFERLVCLDADSGALRWAQERRELVASAAPAWAGGGGHPAALLWAYISPMDDEEEGASEDADEEEDAPARLHVERFDLATGRSCARSRVRAR